MPLGHEGGLRLSAIVKPLAGWLLAGDLINIDETTVQVLKEPGRDPTSTSYRWVFRRGDPDKQVLLYQYHQTRSGEVVRYLLGDYQGYVQTDGYVGYDFLDFREEVHHIGCLVHAQRKFAYMVKAQGKNAKSRSAHRAVFFQEAVQRRKRMLCRRPFPCKSFQRRQLESRPVLDDFKKWLDKKKLHVPPESMLSKAVAYTLNQWHPARTLDVFSRSCQWRKCWKTIRLCSPGVKTSKKTTARCIYAKFRITRSPSPMTSRAIVEFVAS